MSENENNNNNNNSNIDKGKPCAFCGRPKGMYKSIVQNPNGSVGICDDCIKICNEILKQEERKHKKEEKLKLPKPETIKAELDRYIVGQDKAKEVLAVSVYNHYKRINYAIDMKEKQGDHKLEDVELEKSNVLMLGPTGCGKTLMARTLAKILDVPFASADATTLTEAGYVGDDVENILLKLIQAADYDIKRAERGIIYIDEIDKIARKSENVSITRDVSGEGVQQSLLKILESTVASVPPQGGRKHPNQECLNIDTTNILFICGGAFVGLEKIVEKRVNTKRTLGFGSEVKTQSTMKQSEALAKLEPTDLVKFGLIPEFIGRVPITVVLDDLDENALCRILTEPRNSLIKQYKKMFSLDGVELLFDNTAVSSFAKKAIKLKTGARGLRTILEEVMLPLMYKVPSDDSIYKVILSSESVDERGEGKVEHTILRREVKTDNNDENKAVI